MARAFGPDSVADSVGGSVDSLPEPEDSVGSLADSVDSEVGSVGTMVGGSVGMTIGGWVGSVEGSVLSGCSTGFPLSSVSSGVAG